MRAAPGTLDGARLRRAAEAGGLGSGRQQARRRAARRVVLVVASWRHVVGGLISQTERVRYLANDLVPGMSVEEAGQRYCALASPELYYVLTVELGWTAEQHRRWLSELLVAELFGPESA